MSEQAALVAREARSIHGGLKTLLAGDVWANYREADFQRKNLRRRYLHLLLLYPNARETRDAGTHLWMQTSYAFIALYKQRLSALSAHANATGDSTNPNNNHHNGGNDKKEGNRKQVETRKLLQRFRQFLADEDRFWRALVGRVQRAYGIVLPPHFAANANLPPELLAGAASGLTGGGATASGGTGAEGEDAVEDRMNHFGFPAVPQDGETTEGARVDEGTAHSVLSKALVCLGDIARYREQYKFPPKGKGPHNFHGPHGGGKKGQMYIEPRPNYTRARALYLAAHALAPAEGNAAHQLAILAGYESDTLASVAWYLRALCVRAPFDTAGENLAGVLSRVSAVERRTNNTSKGKKDTDPDGVGEDPALTDEEAEERDPPRVRIERFRRELVLLHALWRERNTPPTQTLALSAHTARAFARLVAARALPEELIVRVVLLSQGAVWVGRMVVVAPLTTMNANAAVMTNADAEKGKDKEKGRKHGRSSSSRALSSTLDAHVETENVNGNGNAKKTSDNGNANVNGQAKQAAHLAHLLALHTALLNVGVRELGEVDVYSVPAPAPVPAAVPVAPRGGHGGRGEEARKAGRRDGGGDAPSGRWKRGWRHGRASAEFRRTLPALRVASKWLLANWGWVREFVGEAEGEAARGKREGNGGDEGEEEAELAAQRVRFWATYADFLRLLARTFPAGLLPKLTVDGGTEGAVLEGEDQGRDGEEGEVELELELEEDVDVRGWLPLRGLMGGPCPLPPAPRGGRRRVFL
ncbi:hypothetical protein MSAN_01905400 [Mycena sanguinolenta]|uniref:Telomerase activating protein Est1-like N-terminal domain-containing protein n=1 Tax=Mycena sanguinolenta TaxID=230812 RepID=A0A8H6XQI4_9AGAR|nr:hypothetical protein MSAN_01905400 [Mycena sanguinolenta]